MIAAESDNNAKKTKINNARSAKQAPFAYVTGVQVYRIKGEMSPTEFTKQGFARFDWCRHHCDFNNVPDDCTSPGMAGLEMGYLEKLGANNSSIEFEREERKRTGNVRLPSSMGGMAVQPTSMEVYQHGGFFEDPTRDQVSIICLPL